LGKLTPRQKAFDITEHLPADMSSGEKINQTRDPFTGDVYGPGLKISADGEITRIELTEELPD
jgi:hypothetical protein